MQTDIQKDIQYYENRVKRLGLKGEYALHIGERNLLWTKALEKTYASVVTVENIHGNDFLNGKIIDNSSCFMKMPFPDESFDTVFCSITIPLLEGIFEELSRITKDHGLLYFNFNALVYNEFFAEHEENYIEKDTSSWLLVLMSYMVRLMQKMNWSMIRKYLFEYEGERKKEYTKIKNNLLRMNINIVLPMLLSKHICSRKRGEDYVRKYIIDRLNGIGELEFKAITEELIGALGNLHIQSIVSKQDKNIWCEFIDSIGYLNLNGSSSQLRKIWAEFILRMLSRGYYGLFSEKPIMQSKMYFFNYLEFLGFKEIGTTSEGNLRINTDIISEGSIYQKDEFIFETLLIKETGQIGEQYWPTIDHLKANNSLSAYRFSGIRADYILSNERHTQSIDILLTDNLRNAAKRIPREKYLKKIVNDVTSDAADDEDAFMKLYRFIQDMLFHHPSLQLMKSSSQYEDDAVVILLSGIGRCSHVSSVVAELYKYLGYKTRVTQLYRHLCGEVHDGKRWRLVDADAFKGGVYPRNNEGEWLSLADLSVNQIKIDDFPAIGHMICREGLWMKNAIGRQCMGYTDAGLAWERPYTSYIYFGGEYKKPPAPPTLNVRKTARGIFVSASTIQPEIEVIRLALDKKSRGWSYMEVPSAKYLKTPTCELGKWVLNRNKILEGYTLPYEGSHDQVYLNIFALDHHLCMNPQIFVWPGHELVFNI